MTGTEHPPAVSVLMDVSDGERYLDRALASLSAQSFADFEIVLVAHGTTASTEAIIADWEQREPRLRVIRQPRLSLWHAHTLAARAARAPLLARLDADDMARPDRLERQVAMFAADPALGFAGSAVEIVDARDRPLSILRNPTGHAAIVAALGACCPIVHSTLMVRAEPFWRAGGYRDGLNISEDYDLYTRLAEVARGANSAETLVAYRVHDGSLTSRNALRMAITNEAVRLARIARLKGVGEPFASGTPALRRLTLIEPAPRAEVRRRVLATARQSRFSRRLQTSWLTGMARDFALKLGLRPAYSALFRAVAHLSDLRPQR